MYFIDDFCKHGAHKKMMKNVETDVLTDVGMTSTKPLPSMILSYLIALQT